MRKFVMGGLAAASLASCLFAQPSSATDPNFPRRATIFKSWLVRAYDQCTAATTSTIAVGLPAAGCAATVSDDPPPPNGSTPAGATMTVATVYVKKFHRTSMSHEGKVRMYGTGFQPGQRVSVRLTLRTTRSELFTKHPPSTSMSVTFQDTTVDCGNQNVGCFVGRPTGAIVGSQDLDDCLTQNGVDVGLAQENIEIVSASLVNCDTGNTIATPGIIN